MKVLHDRTLRTGVFLRESRDGLRVYADFGHGPECLYSHEVTFLV